MPEDKKYKLWESLNSAGYYTKSYDEFNQQFSTPESQQKLYGALSSNGYYTKTQEDFSTQFFGGTDVKKKEPSEQSSSGLGVGSKQSGASSEVQSGSTEKKIEPITQVGDEFRTVSEVESGKKEPQNEYLRNGATYTKEEYDQLNQASQDITAKKQAYDETVKEFQKSGTIPSELISFRKKEYEDALAQQQKLVIQKTFPDDEKFANFYDLNTMQPMSVPAKDYESFVTDFYDKNLKERFGDKSIDDLSWDEKRVLNYQFGVNYLKKEDLQSYLDQTGGDVDLGSIPHAWNQFGQAAWSGISDMVNSLSISDNMATVDYLNAQFSKAYTGAISKDEYNTEIKSYGDKLRAEQAAGLPMILPGVNPSGGYKVDPITNKEIPVYTKDDVEKFIREIPPFEDAVLKSQTGTGLSNNLPYPQSNMFRDLANKLDKVIAVVPNNPKKKDSFVLNDVPQALGSSAGFAMTGFLGIPELSFLTGAMQNASSTYKQAINLGASPEEAQKAFVQGLGVGTTEGAPVEIIFKGLTKKFGGKVADVIIGGIAGGTAESIQEGLQGVANREILDFIDQNRQKENIGRSMGAAAVTGLLMGMASKVVNDPNATTEEKKVAASLMTDLQEDVKKMSPEKEVVKEEIKPVAEVKEEVIETPVEEKKVEPEGKEIPSTRVESTHEEETQVKNEEIYLSEEIKVEPVEEVKPDEKQVELDKKIEEGKKKLAEIKAKNSQLEIKISDDEDSIPISKINSGSTQPTTDKSESDTTVRDSKFFSDIIKTKSFRSKGFSGLDIPSQSKVKSIMFSLGDNKEILDSVIKFIPVDVMNMLRRKKISAEMLFHDETMFSKAFPVNFKSPVSVTINESRSIMKGLAFAVTKMLNSGSKPLLTSFKDNPALTASKSDISSHDANIENISRTGKSEGEKIEDKKAEIDNLKNDLNNIGVTGDQNKKRAELMAAYTDLAGLYIQKGIKSAVEFAKELGEELSDIVQEAWDKAVKSNAPEKEGKKKSLLNRAYEGEDNEKVKEAIAAHGLNYEPESWDEGKRKAREFISDIGLDAALSAVKNGDIVGAPAAFVWAEAIDKVHNDIADATSEAEIDELNKKEAELLSQFDIEARRKGQFISALQDIYKNADFNYNLESRIKEYEEITGAKIPKEIEDKMKELDARLKDANQKIKELEQQQREKEEQAAFDAIKQSVERAGKGMTQEEIDEQVKRGVEEELNKAMYRLSKVRKRTAKKAIEALEKLDKSLSGMYFESTIGIPVAIVRGGIKAAIAGIKLTGKVADAIESGLRYIQEEYEKQFGEKLKKSDYDRAKNLLKENLEGAGLDTSSRKDKSVREKDGKIKIPHELIRELVESGVDNITDLTAEVLKEVKKSVPDATERQVRDAITQYGRTVNLNQEEIEVEIRRLKRIGRDLSKLEDIAEGKRPKRSGLQRDKLDAEERALQKQVKEGLKTLPMDVETQEKELRTSLDAIERRLENQIEDLQREIDKGEKSVKEKKTIEYSDRIKELIKERDRIKGIRDEMFADEGLTTEERIDRAKKATERAINDIEKRIEEGNLEPKKLTKIESPELTELRGKLAEARAKLKGLQDIAGITDKIRLEQQKKAVTKQIQDLQTRIDTSDFAKKVKKPLFADNELAKLKAEKQRLKDEFDKLKYQAELKSRSLRQKIVDGLFEAWNLTRALRATMEFSPFLIQLGFYSATHLPHAIKSLANGISHFFSKTRAENFQKALEASPLYDNMREDKLSITRTDYKQNAKEELYISNWIKPLWNFIFRKGFPLHNLPEKFERAATGMMNTMRVLRYMDGVRILQRQGITRESNPEDYKNVASIVNTATLRTSLGKAEMASKLLSIFFFSARAWASILKTWTPYAFYEFGRMTSKDAITGKTKISVAQKMQMADYAKYLGVTAGFIGMLAVYLNNDDDDETSVEFDPTSSDFMIAKIGNTRIDPWGGRRPMVVLQARIMLEALNEMGVYDGHSYKSLSGETNRLGMPYKTPTGLGLIGQMTRNKLSPSMQIVANALDTYLNKQGEQVDKYGNPYDMSDEVLNNLYPIYIETLNELYKDQPDAIASLLSFYAFLGGGVQTYLPKEKKDSSGIPEIKSIPEIKTIKTLSE